MSAQAKFDSWKNRPLIEASILPEATASAVRLVHLVYALGSGSWLLWQFCYQEALCVVKSHMHLAKSSLLCGNPHCHGNKVGVAKEGWGEWGWGKKYHSGTHMQRNKVVQLKKKEKERAGDRKSNKEPSISFVGRPTGSTYLVILAKNHWNYVSMTTIRLGAVGGKRGLLEKMEERGYGERGWISNAKKPMTHGGEGLEEEMNEGGEERWVGIGGRAVPCSQWQLGPGSSHRDSL
ncbi:hypothetical protein INR49_030593 [Caranx melampygus]|nr:hypothetical protein INR49_030593 [Caranx melampygus]